MICKWGCVGSERGSGTSCQLWSSVTNTTVSQCQVAPNWNWGKGRIRIQHLHDFLFFFVTRKFWFAHWFGPALPEKSPGMFHLLLWTSWCQDCSLWSVTPKFYRYVCFQTEAELHSGSGYLRNLSISGSEVTFVFTPFQFWFTAQVYPLCKKEIIPLWLLLFFTNHQIQVYYKTLKKYRMQNTETEDLFCPHC